MKLHLGCGDKYLQGFVNIDIRKTKANDVIDKASESLRLKRSKPLQQNVQTIDMCIKR